jgi:long-chain acyl-CoA synthetase
VYPGAFAVLTPDKPAALIADTGETLTYRELEEGSARLARVLHDAGLRRGDTLAMLTGNDLTAFEVYWAAMRSGLYLTAVNHNLAADEIAFIVNDSSAKALVVAGSKKDVAEAIVGQTPGLVLRLAYGAPVQGYGDYAAATKAVSPEPLADQPRGSDMLYSSGTTGRPKGIKVPLPDRQVSEPGDQYVGLFVPYFRMSADSVYLSPAPIYHAAPLRFCATVQSIGGTVVMMSRFDPEGALRAIEERRVTHLQMVPTMFVRLLKLDEGVRTTFDHSSLQVVIHAAAPCPPDVKRAMIDWWGPILTEYYASTEGNGGTLVSTADWLRKPSSVGKPFIGVAHICDEDGTERATGETGLVYFERDVLPFEYHNDPVKTAEAQHPQHPTWTTVGDIGYLDEDGFLFLTDRKAFMIISGGVNIYPQELENALALHPSVFDAAVFGVPDPEMGQRVVAAIQLAEGVPADDSTREALTGFLAEKVARFKLPRTIHFVDELPRTPTGKLCKHQLVNAYS